ncbi:MAG: hypothetical protein R8K53_08930, partial [Mariprofundaceae bacterium]
VIEQEDVVSPPQDTEIDAAADDAPVQADDSLLFEDKESLSPEAGVDYLAEADVYLRYGMDEEALQQLKLALEQRPDNAEAHAKLVQMLQGRGDDGAANAALDAARLVLSGAALQTFEASIGESGEDEAQPDIGESESGEAAEEHTQIDNALADDDMMLDDLSEPDSSDSNSDEAVPLPDNGEADGADDAMQADSAATGDMDLDLSGIDMSGLDDSKPEEGHVDAAVDADKEAAGDLDFDVDFSTEDIPKLETSTSEPQADDEQIVESVSGDEASSTESEEFVSSIQISTDDTDVEAAAQVAPADESTATEVATDLPEDELNLDDILGDLDALENPAAFDTDNEAAAQVAPADESTTTEVATDLPEDDLNLDDILGDLDALENPTAFDTDNEGAAQVAPADESTATEVATDLPEDEFNLDDILGDLDMDGEDLTVAAPDEQEKPADQDANADSLSASDDVAGMDISHELDDLLAEWDGDAGADAEGAETGSVETDAGPGNLNIDRARSLLAEGDLDEAEIALQAADDSDRRGDTLIGQAELAARRGDSARKTELLGEAESLIDDANRDWFESVKNLDV